MNIKVIDAARKGRNRMYSESDVQEVIDALGDLEEGQAVAFGDDCETETMARGRSNTMRRLIAEQSDTKVGATVVRNDDGTFRPAVSIR